MTKEKFETTTWINTIYEYAEPKKWVALPIAGEGRYGVVVFDCNGEKVFIATNKAKHSETE